MSATIPGVQSKPRGIAASSTSAISISHLNKTFKLPREKLQTLKEWALHPRKRRQYDILHAVRDVSLEIRQGEFFGIVGRNGSGKSTLLKCLAGIYDVNSGDIAIRGRLSPFIELGVGFNPTLAARDNVIINAIMLGLTRREAEARFDHIVQFAELEEFVDLRLKNYSSGMQVRLAFSVAVQVDADILLMDEVLAVGDASFQHKCFDEFQRLRSEGKTIVLVTHDMGAIHRFCDRAMLLERGQVIDVGEPDSIARQYNEMNFKRPDRVAAYSGAEEPEPEAQPTATELVAQIRNARFESPDGEPILTIAQGEPCRVRVEVKFNSRVENPAFLVSMRNEVGLGVLGAETSQSREPTGAFVPGDVAVVTLSFENWFAPGKYTITAAVSGEGPSAEIYDTRDELCSIIVHATASGGGIVDLPHTLVVERSQ